MRRRPTREEYEVIWGILAFQFDERVATALLDPPDEIEVILGSKGRIRYILRGGKHLLTLRPTDGFFTLSVEAAKIIKTVTQPPRYRVIIKGDREIKGSVLARDVVEADPSIEAGDEVLVVTKVDELVGVGRAKVPGRYMSNVMVGEVVRLRR